MRRPYDADDAAYVTGVLREIAPLVGDQRDLPVVERRRLGEALTQATDTPADAARWNRHTLERMGRSRQVLVPGYTLTGEQVTDDAIRAAAQLEHRYAPVPDATVDACGPLYARTYPSPSPAPTGTGGIALHVEPALMTPGKRGAWIDRQAISRGT